MRPTPATENEWRSRASGIDGPRNGAVDGGNGCQDAQRASSTCHSRAGTSAYSRRAYAATCRRPRWRDFGAGRTTISMSGPSAVRKLITRPVGEIREMTPQHVRDRWLVDAHERRGCSLCETARNGEREFRLGEQFLGCDAP